MLYEVIGPKPIILDCDGAFIGRAGQVRLNHVRIMRVQYRGFIRSSEKVIGMPVLERSIDRTELIICDEVFLTGTAAQITAVTMVDHHPVGDGKMGTVAMQLRELFQDVVRGRNPAFQSWLTPVYS